jgi:hypothetical protein
MELTGKTPGLRVYTCPLCRLTKEEILDVKRDIRPKCGICDRTCVPQGEVFACPNCRALYDPCDDKSPVLSCDGAKGKPEKSPINRSHHRGGLEPARPLLDRL